MRFLIATLLLLLPLVVTAQLNQECVTDPAVDSCLDVFPGGIQANGDANCIKFADLGTPENGTVVNCCNCAPTNPCTSGTAPGSVAVRTGGMWLCIGATT